MKTVLTACLLIAGIGCATIQPRPQPQQHRQPPAPPPRSEKTLIIHGLGDLNLDHKIPQELKESGRNFDSCFDNTRALLKAGDFNIANLEAPVTTSKKSFAKEYTFAMDPASLGAVARANIRIVNLANNHILDAFEDGLLDTIRYLNANSIAHIGAGHNLAEARQAVIMNARGMNIAFLGYSYTFPPEFYAGPSKPGTAFGHLSHIKEDLAKIRNQVDLIVVSFHWGEERARFPKKYQIENAHFAIDHGADLIFGHHSHVIQGVEIYKNKPIFYSLANYVFGTFSNNARTSFIPRVYFDGTAWTRIELYPLDVYAFDVRFNPVILKREEAAAVLKELSETSEPFGTKIQISNDVGVIIPLTK